MIQRQFASVFFVLVGALVGCSGGGGGGGTPSGTASDASCVSICARMNAANCPGFQIAVCEANCKAEVASAPSTCKPVLDTLASCALGAIYTCGVNGPQACAAQEQAYDSCKANPPPAATSGASGGMTGASGLVVGGSSGASSGLIVGGSSGANSGLVVGGSSGASSGLVVGGSSGASSGLIVGGSSGASSGLVVGGSSGAISGSSGIGSVDVCAARPEDTACDACARTSCCVEARSCVAQSCFDAGEDCMSECQLSDDENCALSCYQRTAAGQAVLALNRCIINHCSVCNDGGDVGGPSGSDVGGTSGSASGGYEANCLPRGSVPADVCGSTSKPIGHECGGGYRPFADCVPSGIDDVWCCGQ